MAFDILETLSRDRADVPFATLSYMRLKNSKKPSLPQLRITSPRSISGETTSDYFYLMVGSGDDDGKLLIVGDKATGFGTPPATMTKPATLKATHRWNFGFVPRLGDEIFGGERFPIARVTVDVFEVTMPVGFIPPLVTEKPAPPPAGKGKRK